MSENALLLRRLCVLLLLGRPLPSPLLGSDDVGDSEPLDVALLLCRLCVVLLREWLLLLLVFAVARRLGWLERVFSLSLERLRCALRLAVAARVRVLQEPSSADRALLRACACCNASSLARVMAVNSWPSKMGSMRD